MKKLARQILIPMAIFALFVSFGARNSILAQVGEGHTAIKVCHAVPEPAHQTTDRYEEIIVDDDGSDGNINYMGHDHHPKDVFRRVDEVCPAIVSASINPSTSPTASPSASPSPSPEASVQPSSTPDPGNTGDNGGSGGGSDGGSNTGGVVLGASTSGNSGSSARVLGARTMASAGSSENILLLAFIAGSLMSGFGIKMYATSAVKSA